MTYVGCEGEDLEKLLTLAAMQEINDLCWL